MADLADVNSQLMILIRAALADAGITNAKIATNFPPIATIQNVARDQVPIMSLYNKHTDYKTLDMGFEQSETDNPCGIASSTNDSVLPPNQTVVLTINLAEGSEAVNANDLISCELSNGDFNEAATVAAAAGDTLASLAQKLADEINIVFAGLVVASVFGNVISISNSTVGFRIFTHTANTATVNSATQWAFRAYQLIMWSGDLDTKKLFQKTMQDFLASLNEAKGYALPSTEFVELRLTGSVPDETDQLKDIYCDSFLFTLEHMVTVATTKYGIVATKRILENI